MATHGKHDMAGNNSKLRSGSHPPLTTSTIVYDVTKSFQQLWIIVRRKIKTPDLKITMFLYNGVRSIFKWEGRGRSGQGQAGAEP